MKFCTENWADIQKYFQNTYMKFPQFAGDRVHYIDRVRENMIQGTYMEGDKQEQFQFDLYRAQEHPAPEVEFILPKKSWFQHGNDARFLYRLPARQYKKGVSGENTAIVGIRGTSTLFDPMGVSFPTVNAYVAKPAFVLLSSVPKEHTSTALSPRIAVHRCGKLFVDMFHAATVDWEARTVKMHESIFTTEVARVAGLFRVVTDQEVKATRKKQVTKKYSEDELQF